MPEVMTPVRAPREPRNGVNTPALLATINAVKETPALAKFQFRATNRWISGTYSESRIESFSGAGGEHKHQTDFRYGADHPAVLVGEDRGPTPIEFLLHGLASCITAGIANIAAARGVTLTSVESQRRRRHRSAGHPGTVRHGPQRLRAHPHQLHYRRRRTAGEAAPDRRAVARTVGGLRCAHQRRAGGRQRQYTLRRGMARIDTVIIGAGQAGLAMSRCLSDLGIEHVVLERGKVAQRWRSQSWDSLHLLTPNWMTRLPGFEYDGDDRDGFMSAPELIAIPGTLRDLVRGAGHYRYGRCKA